MRFDGDPAGDKPLLIGFELTREHVNRVAAGNIESITETGVLATSFSMSVGETVVVGTSKLNGGDTAALILLLTAAR